MESHAILKMPEDVKGCVLFAIGCRRYEMAKLIMAITRSTDQDQLRGYSAFCSWLSRIKHSNPALHILQNTLSYEIYWLGVDIYP